MRLSIGPGALVAAAFIGPGTVTACTVAGAEFGFGLLWALVFATIATIILQEMAARLGVAGRLGLGEALMSGAGNPVLKAIIAILIGLALALGNAAYEAGNISGGALGLEAILGDERAPFNALVIAVAVIAGAALWSGQYKFLERILIGLVLVMSMAFAGAALMTKPDFGAMLQGLIPRVPDSGLLKAIALIGTTIVPYNLFLHAAAARDRWTGDDPGALKAAVRDTRLSIGLGGLVSILILSTAASAMFGQVNDVKNASDMALALESSFGSAARYLVGIGLFAAGLTSAITAPMATGYAVTEIIATPPGETKRNRFRLIALAILAIGTTVALLGIKPVTLILVAQVANGLLLPVIAIFLLVAMNRKSLLGDATNGWVPNILGGGVILITIGLGSRLILRALGVWP